MTKDNLNANGLSAWVDRYFPCPFDRGGSVLVILGVASAIAYVYTNTWYRGMFRYLPENLMVLTFLVSAWGQRRRLKSDLVFKLLVLSALIPWLLFAINALIDYDSALKYRSLNVLLKFFLFLPLAWWIGGSWPASARMLAIAFFGLLTAILLDPDLAQSINELLAGVRIDFAIHNAQHGALLFGIVVVFCLCSYGLLLKEKVSAWRISLLILAFATGLIGLFATQTRGVFLGLLVVGLVAIVRRLRLRLIDSGNASSFRTGLFVFGLLALLMVGFGKQILENRTSRDNPAIQMLLSGNLADLPFTSVGVRVHSWVESLDWIAERPITGWGLKARSDVIRLADHFPETMKRFGHLHNGYLELLVGYGVTGFGFLVFLWLVLLSRIKRAANTILFSFAFYGSVLLLVLNVFESFLFYWSGIYVMALIMAGGYSQHLAGSLTAPCESESISALTDKQLSGAN